MARIPLVSGETLTPEQKPVYERIVSGPRGTLVGPLRAALHSPELADRWQALGAQLRYNTSLPPRLSELAILVCARHWNSLVEWLIHAEIAAKAGLEAGIIEALRTGRAPALSDADDRVVYDYARELLAMGQVSDAAYAAALERLKVIGVVELAGLVGYYSMVAMTLNVHQIPPPPPGPSAPAPLDPLAPGTPTLLPAMGA